MMPMAANPMNAWTKVQVARSRMSSTCARVMVSFLSGGAYLATRIGPLGGEAGENPQADVVEVVADVEHADLRQQTVYLGMVRSLGSWWGLLGDPAGVARAGLLDVERRPGAAVGRRLSEPTFAATLFGVPEPCLIVTVPVHALSTSFRP